MDAKQLDQLAVLDSHRKALLPRQSWEVALHRARLRSPRPDEVRRRMAEDLRVAEWRSEERAEEARKAAELVQAARRDFGEAHSARERLRGTGHLDEATEGTRFQARRRVLNAERALRTLQQEQAAWATHADQGQRVLAQLDAEIGRGAALDRLIEGTGSLPDPEPPPESRGSILARALRKARGG